MYKISEAKMRKAVEQCNGTWTDLRRYLKVRSIPTAQSHLEKFPELLEEFNRKKDELLDHAEDVLIDNLKSKNDLVRARTSEFILKNLSGSRFLDVDRQEESVQAKLVSLIAKMVANSD